MSKWPKDKRKIMGAESLKVKGPGKMLDLETDAKHRIRLFDELPEAFYMPPAELYRRWKCEK